MPSRLRSHYEFCHIHFLTFSCFRRLRFFHHDNVKLTFIDAMHRVRDKMGLRWLGYVIMPEHVHVLVLPQQLGSDKVIPISQILHDLKGFSGHFGKEALRVVWRGNHSLGTGPLDAWATGSGPKRFWKPRGYDFNVVDERKLPEKLNYIHDNPVRRELIELPEQWRWSSYRFYESGDDSLIGMDWDGGFPLVL